MRDPQTAGVGYTAGRLAMALLYLVAGSLHFVRPQPYVSIMPPWLPSPLALVYISGAAEMLGGLGVAVPDGWIFPRSRAVAAWGLVLLLIAVFPANLHMALHPELFPQLPPWALWLRLPVQIPLIAWAWFYTRPRPAIGTVSAGSSAAR